jgi:hypothetical protein
VPTRVGEQAGGGLPMRVGQVGAGQAVGVSENCANCSVNCMIRAPNAPYSAATVWPDGGPPCMEFSRENCRAPR